MKHSYIAAIGLAVVALIVSVVIYFLPNTADITLIGKGDTIIELTVEVADSDSERSKGLMDRKSLKEDSGMLFVFDEEQELRFWMKNTFISLDIIFFDIEGTFVSSTTMHPCTVSPCTSYKSQSFSKYALELPEGFIKKNGVRTGWKLDYKKIK